MLAAPPVRKARTCASTRTASQVRLRQLRVRRDGCELSPNVRQAGTHLDGSPRQRQYIDYCFPPCRSPSNTRPGLSDPSHMSVLGYSEHAMRANLAHVAHKTQGLPFATCRYSLDTLSDESFGPEELQKPFGGFVYTTEEVNELTGQTMEGQVGALTRFASAPPPR